MDSDIRIVCIQISPDTTKGGTFSASSSGQRGEIRAVLEQAMDSLGPSRGTGDSFRAHLDELTRKALPSGKTVLLPAGIDVDTSFPSTVDSEAPNGSIVKATA